jgi:hypothetical protein
VEWYQQFRPKEFKIRYGVQGFATQRVRQVDGAGNPAFDKKTGQPVFETRKHVLVAMRKTHLTVLPNGSEIWEDGKGPETLDEGGDE